MELHSNYAFLQEELDSHKLPATGVRMTLADHARRLKTDWADLLRVDLDHHSDGGGIINVSLLSNLHNGSAYREHQWATTHSLDIGRIGFIRTAQGDERLAWQTACGYGPDGKPDDNQVWRLSDQPGALLIEAFARQVWPEQAGRFYAACLNQSLDSDKRRRVEQRLRYYTRVITDCLTHRNTVRYEIKGRAGRVRYYDPQSDSIQVGTMLQHVQKWHGTKYVVKTSGNGSRAYEWYYGITWDRTRPRKTSYIMFRNHRAKEFAVVFGDHVPKYVQEMVLMTDGRAQWFPNPGKVGKDAWHRHIHDYLAGTNASECLTQVEPPAEYHSDRDGYIMRY